ncbi:MAG: ABC transporter permease [Halanaeroarchaeum sp.]
MSMRWYVARRVLFAVFATYIALSLTFGLLVLSPNTGDMQEVLRCTMAGGDMQDCRDRITSDLTLIQKYRTYVVNMFTFDWGWSELRAQPVTTALAQAWPRSAQFMIPSVLLSMLVGYGIGLYSSVNQYTTTDYVGAFVAFFGLSIPNFWFAIILILVFGVWVRSASLFGISLQPLALPVFYDTTVLDKHGMFSWANVRQLILPIIVVSTGAIAGQMRYARAQALEHVNSEFVKVAKAKGAGEWRLVLRHVFRVALVPLSTFLVGQFLGLLWTGSIVIETIFQIPGIGLLTIAAIQDGDTPLVMATTLIPVFLAIFGNLLQDLAYVVFDPRIDYGDR